MRIADAGYLVAIAILALVIGVGAIWLADATNASERGHGGDMTTQSEHPADMSGMNDSNTTTSD